MGLRTGLPLALGWMGLFLGAKKGVYSSEKGEMPTEFSPIALQGYLNKFSQSISFDSGYPGAEIFNQFENNRPKSVTGLPDVKIGSKSFDEALRAAIRTANGDNPEATQIKEELNKALELTTNFATAKQRFAREAAAISAAMHDLDADIHPLAMEAYIQELKKPTEDALNAQHVHDIAELTRTFQKPEFRAKLTRVFGLDEEAIDNLEKNIKKSLEQAHKKNLADAMKPLQESQANLHQRLQSENARINYLAALYEHNAKMREVIDKLAAQNRQEGDVTVAFSENDNGTEALLKGIKISDLDLLQTLTGRDITKKSADEFTMQLPMPLTSPVYYGQYNQNLKKDMQSLAMAVRASGYSSITMSVDHKNEKRSLKLAQEAYEACRLSGYPADKIKIKVNGKEMKAEEIFAKQQSELKKIDGQVQRIEEKMKVLHKKQQPSVVQQENCRRVVAGIRDNMRVAETAASEEQTQERPESPAPAQ